LTGGHGAMAQLPQQKNKTNQSFYRLAIQLVIGVM